MASLTSSSKFFVSFVVNSRYPASVTLFLLDLELLSSMNTCAGRSRTNVLPVVEKSKILLSCSETCKKYHFAGRYGRSGERS